MIATHKVIAGTFINLGESHFRYVPGSSHAAAQEVGNLQGCPTVR